MMKTELNLTQSRLKEVLKYDPLTGVFIWLEAISIRVKIGDMAGYLDPEGYCQIRVDTTLYKAHRLAYLYITGEDIIGDIHHKNDNKHDNRWENLENLSKVDHARVRGLLKTNTSGVPGVIWHKQNQKWEARIYIDNSKKYLGTFIDFRDAVYARWQAEILYNFPNAYKSIAYKWLQDNE